MNNIKSKTVEEFLKKYGYGGFGGCRKKEIVFDMDLFGTKDFRNYYVQPPNDENIITEKWLCKVLTYASYWVRKQWPVLPTSYRTVVGDLYKNVFETWDEAMDVAWNVIEENKEHNRIRMIHKKRLFKLINLCAKELKLKRSARWFVKNTNECDSLKSIKNKISEEEDD